MSKSQVTYEEHTGDAKTPDSPSENSGEMVKTLTGAELRFSRPLDVHKWSEYPESNAISKHIYEEALSNNPFLSPSAKLQRHFKIVIIDLFAAWMQNKRQFVSYTRNKSRFSDSRLKSVHVSGRFIVCVMDALLALGYIEHAKGVYFKDYKFESRARSSAKLIDLIFAFKISGKMISRKTKPIYLRDKNKDIVKFKNTALTRKMEKEILEINEFISNHNITIMLSEEEKHDIIHRMRLLPDISSSKLYRVFNNLSFQQGGRLYGHWAQNIPREYRKKITINDQPTCELDYSGLHIKMLYCMNNLPQPSGDVYAVAGYKNEKRPLLKVILQAIINADNEASAHQGAARAARERGIKVKKGEIADLAKKMKEKHAPISSFFCSGKGTTLQYYDSQMAIAILLRLSRTAGIPCLPIHDSFIVPTSAENDLRQAMIDAFESKFGHTPAIDKKY